MRPIKFRGKSKNMNRWLYGSLINNAFYGNVDGSANCHILDTDYIDYDCFEDIGEQLTLLCVYPESVGQYTGLKDKSGRDVYEGDVAWDDHYECYGVVKFDGGNFIYEWENICEDLSEVYDNIEIVGNIYEDKHLLEVQT